MTLLSEGLAVMVLIPGQMEFGQVFMDLCQRTLTFTLEVMSIPQHFSTVIFSVFFACIFIGSAAIAESIGERKRRGRWLHFILGFFIPLAYPALIFAFLPRRKIHRRKEETPPMDAQINVPAFDSVEAKTETGQAESGLSFSTDSPVFNPEYFRELAVDDEGNPRGPFLLSIDNTEIRVNRILEILPNVVVLETASGEGGRQTLRIPYRRIQNFREI